MLLGLFVLLSSAVLTASSTLYDDYAVFEKLAQVPDGWVELEQPVSADKMLNLRIMLAPQNVNSFQQQVIDMSTPSHSSYGSHMSRDQVQKILAPHSAATDAVADWLSSAGVGDRVESSYDTLKVRVSVPEAEDLLQAKYRYYRNMYDGNTVLRTLAYSLPAVLHDHIALVQPTTMFGLRAMRSTINRLEEKTTPADMVAERKMMQKMSPNTPKVPADAFNATFCNNTVNPACLATLYDFAGYTPTGKGELGITGYLGQAAIEEDLKKFLDRFAPASAGANFSVISINGGTNYQNGTDATKSGEANLDVQYGISIAHPIPATFFTTAGTPPYIEDIDDVADQNEPYLEFLDHILKQESLPSVLSTSYGESEQTVPLSYRLATCNMLAQLGARGTSVIFSSGDSGPGQGCLSNDGLNRTIFTPVFPAGCPFVTSVGATFHVEPEQAAKFSSGGFSDTWERPDYQKAAVDQFFDSTDKYKPFEPYFNRTGRATPDVSAQGVNFEVYIFGKTFMVDGTSASAPVFAGIVSLLNDLRLQEGKSHLGFLNPLLYGDAKETFTDITTGRSEGCTGKKAFGDMGQIEYAAVIPNAGWDAVPGWDPVTGLGTPNFQKLRAVV